MKTPAWILLACASAAVAASSGGAQRETRGAGCPSGSRLSEAGHFAAWPANNGIWAWQDEILVGFTLGYYKANDESHSIDVDRPARAVLARSLDGGETWKLEDPENFVGDGGTPQPAPAG